MKHLHENPRSIRSSDGGAPDLRGIVGKNEPRAWLGADRRVAERSAHAMIGAFHRRIDAAKAVLAAAALPVRSAAEACCVSALLADDRANGRRHERRDLDSDQDYGAVIASPELHSGAPASCLPLAGRTRIARAHGSSTAALATRLPIEGASPRANAAVATPEAARR